MLSKVFLLALLPCEHSPVQWGSCCSGVLSSVRRDGGSLCLPRTRGCRFRFWLVDAVSAALGSKATSVQDAQHCYRNQKECSHGSRMIIQGDCRSRELEFGVLVKFAVNPGFIGQAALWVDEKLYMFRAASQTHGSGHRKQDFSGIFIALVR